MITERQLYKQLRQLFKQHNVKFTIRYGNVIRTIDKHEGETQCPLARACTIITGKHVTDGDLHIFRGTLNISGKLCQDVMRAADYGAFESTLRNTIRRWRLRRVCRI